MTMIDLSIIIPVYNGSKYLKKCLDSIYYCYKDIPFNFETIIINDGSTDNSDVIYSQYRAKFNNIIIIENSNNGVSYSRNCGIDIAQGKYVTFIDCDDCLINDWYLSIEKELKLSYDIIFFSKYFNKDYSDNTPLLKLLSYITTYNDENIRISGPYSKLFSTVFLKKHNIKFNTNLINGEDMLFNIEATLHCTSSLMVDKSFYIVRHNSFSATSRFDERMIQSEKTLNDSIFLALEDSNIEIESLIKNIFLSSIRTLSYRISRIRKYKYAKIYYKEISDDCFFNEKFNIYEYDANLKSMILYYLFKYRFYFLIYCLCKIKNKSHKNDYFEIL